VTGDDVPPPGTLPVTTPRTGARTRLLLHTLAMLADPRMTPVRPDRV